MYTLFCKNFAHFYPKVERSKVVSLVIYFYNILTYFPELEIEDAVRNTQTAVKESPGVGVMWG